MTCREIEDRILETLEAPGSPDAAIAQHLSSCESCRAFQRTQFALDTVLATRFVAPVPAADFDQALRRRIAADRRRAAWEYAPDLLHLGGGLAGSVVCAWFIPEAAGRVIFLGAGFTLSAYFVQMLVRAWLEQGEES
jgi:predicted anti-sigma-YlaC factor YlaD